MKLYTDIEQSKKLAEILPLESADMCYVIDYAESNKYGTDHFKLEVDTYGLKVRTRDNIPCWSLAALLGVLPEYNLQRTDWPDKTEYKIVVTTDEDNYASKNYDNPVDACYEMIIKLNEQNLL
jgi:hypothetical protein